jgi:formylglycine-generating enzyme required for sulfatase activity
MLPSESNPAGSPNVDPSALIKEGPVHSVTVAPFFMSKYETTQGQWLRFTKRNPSWSQAGKTYGGALVNLLHPLEQVSWEECDRVLFRLKLRFPSEAEWEYATRAGTTTVYWTGNDKKSLKGAVNLSDFYTKTHEGSPAWDYEEWLNDGYPTTAPVGSYDSNPFGLHDVHGNVWECCRDSHSLTYAATPTDGSAFESKDSSNRIIRGGSWAEGAEPCRSASRNSLGPGDRDPRIGFRSAYSLQ